MAECFDRIQKNKWDVEEIQKFNKVLEQSVFKARCSADARGMGLTLQVYTVFWSNFCHEIEQSMESHTITAEVAHELIKPYVDLCAFSHMEALRNRIEEFCEDCPPLFFKLLHTMIMDRASDTAIPQMNRQKFYKSADILEKLMEENEENEGEFDQLDDMDEVFFFINNFNFLDNFLRFWTTFCKTNWKKRKTLNPKLCSQNLCLMTWKKSLKKIQNF